jgi:hypothetical protein
MAGFEVTTEGAAGAQKVELVSLPDAVNLATKGKYWPLGFLVWNAPGVVGKSTALVVPTT